MLRIDLGESWNGIRRSLGAMSVLACLAGLSSPALAAFHVMVIQEVFVGPPGDGVARPVPLDADQRAQYVMLRMTSSGQTFVGGTSLRVEDADGNLLGDFGVFENSVSNGGGACFYPNCPAIIMGTQAARNLFTFNFDQIVDGQHGRAALPRDGGRVCFVSGTSVVDCVAWGNFDCTRSGGCFGANDLRNGDFSANGCDTDFGTPAPPLTFGKALVHGPVADCGFKDSATDYSHLFPHPANNAGTNNNPDSDSDGLINQLDCNDASGAFLWPAVEVQDETVTGHPVSTIAWSSQAATSGTGTTYDVVRGSLAALAGFSDAACLAPDLVGVSTNDASLPLAGQGFYYVERAGTGAGCVGTYGSGFGPPASRDPALASKCP